MKQLEEAEEHLDKARKYLKEGIKSLKQYSSIPPNMLGMLEVIL